MSRPVARLLFAVVALSGALIAQGPPARPGTPTTRPAAAPARPGAAPSARPAARLASAPGGDTPVTTGLVRGNAPGEWRYWGGE